MLRWLLVRLRSRGTLLGLLALLTPLGSIRAQDVPPALPGEVLSEPASSTAPDATTPAARPAPTPRELGEKVLDHAATFQRGDVPQATPASLHGRFSVGLRDKDGSMIRALAERWFTTTPERMYTHRTEALTGSASGVGWNGSKAWFRDDIDKRVILYTDAPDTFSVDLDLLHEQVRLTRLLLTASVMDALRPRLTDIAAAGTRDVTDLDGARHATDVVSARIVDDFYPPPTGGPPPMPGAPPRQLELLFAIDHETGALRELKVTALGRTDVAPQRLSFDFHGPTSSGLRVPGNIRVFTEGETQESLNLGVEERDGLLLFDINAPIDAAIFDPPAPEPAK